MLDALSLEMLLAVAVRLSGLGPMAVAELPPIEWRTPAQLRAEACPDAPERCEPLVALFDEDGPRILLSSELNLQLASDRSFVVHELVHAIEARRQPVDHGSCPASLASERRAYRVQNAYLREQGSVQRHGRMLMHAVCTQERVDASGMLPLEWRLRDDVAIDTFMDEWQGSPLPENAAR